MSLNFAICVFFAIVAAFTWIFRVRPWMDEREVAREMRRKAHAA